MDRSPVFCIVPDVLIRSVSYLTLSVRLFHTFMLYPIPVTTFVVMLSPAFIPKLRNSPLKALSGQYLMDRHPICPAGLTAFPAVSLPVRIVSCMISSSPLVLLIIGLNTASAPTDHLSDMARLAMIPNLHSESASDMSSPTMLP